MFCDLTHVVIQIKRDPTAAVVYVIITLNYSYIIKANFDVTVYRHKVPFDLDRHISSSPFTHVVNVRKGKGPHDANVIPSRPVCPQDMVIGYKCINKRDIARMAINMLKASIEQTASPINSYDLVKRFEELEQAKNRPTFLTTEDREYINAHYHAECSALSSRAVALSARRQGTRGGPLSSANAVYYESRAWPLGIVMYSIDEKLRKTPEEKALLFAMTQIELATCLVFHDATGKDAAPKSLLRFGEDGEDEPELGFKQGEQKLNLKSIVYGAPGHKSHAINNLLRAAGLPMMSNRFDRDNYLNIQWQYVQKGKERLLEKTPKDAWVTSIPYDFASVTHAPVNYLCGSCAPGQATVQPLQDMLWKRSLEMGHRAELSEGDRALVALVYEKQCRGREAGAE